MGMRFAAARDGAALLRIYGQYIDTPVTFEYMLPEEREFAERIGHITAVYPYLVWEEAGRMVGYAYAHRHREREAYQWNAELSIYIDRAFVSRGIGGRMYASLLELLKMQGVKTAYGFVRLPNEKSERLHRALGFAHVGTYHHSGYKCGAWQDVGIYEKEIAPHDAAPEPIIPIWKLPQERVRAILEREQ